MKGYRGLFPPVLVVLLLLSMYVASDNNKKKEAEYEGYLKAARECVAYGIIVDAEVHYQEALDMRPSAELYVEVMNMYIGVEDYYAAQEVGEDILDKYNEDVKVHETLATAYMLDGDYDDFLELHARCKDNNIKSSLIDKYFDDIQYNIEYAGAFLEVGCYSGGRCPAKTEFGWGYVTNKGKKKIDYIYDYAGEFGSGIAPVKTKDGEWYFVDTEGNKKKVLNKIDNVQAIGNVASDIIPVFDGSTWSFYDMEQNLLCGGYDDASSMGNGLAAVKNGELWSIINSSGEKITEQLYTDVIMDDKNVVFRGCYFAQVDGLYYMFNDKGEKITEQGFKNARVFNDTGSYAAVQISHKWGFIDINGNIVIEAKYDDARSFSKDLAAVKVDEKWGYIDLNNELVIENTYQDAKDFNEGGNAMVLVGDRWQLIKLLKYNY